MLKDSSLASADQTQPVVILGGSGFIGSRLAELLIGRGIQVRIGDIQKSRQFPTLFQSCDVTRPETLRNIFQRAGAVINLAAEHRDDVRPVSRYQQVNVDGARHVCQAAREANVSTIIFTSSVAVYGFHNGPVDESGPFKPFNEYGRTKLQAEEVYRSWATEDSARRLVIVRPTVVFGEGNRGNVYNLLRQIASGRFFMVGPGTNVKSMAYVGNIAAFLAHCLSLSPGVHIANYVDAPDMNTRELVARICGSLGKSERVRQIPLGAAMTIGRVLDVVARATGRRFPISAVRIKKFCETTQFKAERVSQWGFQPPYSLIEGLERTLEAEFRS